MKQNINDKTLMKYAGSPFDYLFRCQYPLWMLPAGSESAGYTLMPRNINRILVFAFYTDIRMGTNRQHQRTSVVTPSGEVTDDVDIHEAAHRGDMVAISNAMGCANGDQKLISRKDSHGNVPLHLAVTKGHKEVATYLVSVYPKGSYVLNHDKKSPLDLAVEGCHTDIVGCMLKASVNDDKLLTMLNQQVNPIVHAAITHNSIEMVRTILKHRPELIKSIDEKGWTPLSYASYEGHVEIVKYLVKKFDRKSISYQNSDKEGSYPVHKACLGGQIDVLKVFHSISPKSLERVDKHGRNILHIAAKERGNKLKDVVEYMLSVATSSNTSRNPFNKEDECNYKPLALAQRSKNDQVVQLLNDAGLH